MADPFCRICGAAAVEGSTLCQRHRSQALSFASAFAIEKHAAQTEPGATPAKAAAADAAVTGWDVDAAAKAAAAAQPRSDVLSERIKQSLTAIIDWSKAAGPNDRRWPQLAVYVLRNEIVAGHYFGVADPSAAGKPFDLGAEPWAAALAPGGLVFDRLAKEFSEQRPALERGDLSMVCLDFRWHEGRAVLCVRKNDQQRQPVAAFEAAADGVIALASA